MEALNTGAFVKVQGILAEYYDALYHGDTQRLARVFHPEAHYYTNSGGESLHLNMPTYWPLIAQRKSPIELGEAYDMSVEFIGFAGPACAMARLLCSVLSKNFIDLLALMELEGRWQVLSKVSRFEGKYSS